MSRKQWIILALVVVVFGFVGLLLLALMLGFFAGHMESAGGRLGPVYTSEQTASPHAGYRRTTLTHGHDLFVNDYEEASLELTNPEPSTIIGSRGTLGTGGVAAIPGQPITAYIAVDCGSEMPAYEPFRNVKQPPFDWRTAAFRELTASQQFKFGPVVTTTNAALMAEVVRTLRDGTPVDLPPFPFSGATNLTTLNLASDQLPGLLFCPPLCYQGDGTIYLAESLMPDFTVTPPRVRARWIPAGPMLTQWLKTP